mgnify:CR=1 FL=1
MVNKLEKYLVLVALVTIILFGFVSLFRAVDREDIKRSGPEMCVEMEIAAEGNTYFYELCGYPVRDK